MRVLLVDDEIQVLKGLRRNLSTLFDDSIEIFCASEGSEALEVCAQEPIDVVVTDMKMPTLDGAGLLEAMIKRFPQTIRIVLSGQATRRDVLRALLPMHQYLSKPCSSLFLKEVIESATSQFPIIRNNQTLCRMVGSVDSLPSSMKLVARLRCEIQTARDIEKIGALIGDDISVSAKILQVANSSAFGVKHETYSVVDAAQHLGIETIEYLSSIDEFLTIGNNQKLITELSEKGKAISELAGRIAEYETDCEVQISQARSAGLLLDIGRLVISEQMPEESKAIDNLVDLNRMERGAAEIEILGASHFDIGAYLLSIWGLPQAIVDAVGMQSTPIETLPTDCACSNAVAAATAIYYSNRAKQNKTNDLGQLEHFRQFENWQATCTNETEQLN